MGQTAYTLCAIPETGLSGARTRQAAPGLDWAGWTEEELLREGFAANLTVLKALQHRARLSTAEAAHACCVSIRTYRRWLATGKPNPTAVRLLAILSGLRALGRLGRLGSPQGAAVPAP
ncbi:helix-turn-helix domain-containing protein [Thiorhodococcus minor]|uniref:Helix-turn-helix domain-containing protein n=1 Tax=Thiorhodococcus minor TaxID=57489 RepID=A0A6M0K603_9GAMM|nr:helix-turn-helix domain-containing protein [Thiorhodococcus minor]NEV64674.1 helix-turn-helix domain-containing protein [Thiorhodococcus minor]